MSTLLYSEDQQKKIKTLTKMIGFHKKEKIDWKIKGDTEFRCYAGIFKNFVGTFHVFNKKELIDSKKMEKFILNKLKINDDIYSVLTFDEIKYIIGLEREEIQDFFLPEVLCGNILSEEIDLCVNIDILVSLLRKKRLLSKFAKKYAIFLIDQKLNNEFSVVSDFWYYKNGLYIYDQGSILY